MIRLGGLHFPIACLVAQLQDSQLFNERYWIIPIPEYESDDDGLRDPSKLPPPDVEGDVQDAVDGGAPPGDEDGVDDDPFRFLNTMMVPEMDDSPDIPATPSTPGDAGYLTDTTQPLETQPVWSIDHLVAEVEAAVEEEGLEVDESSALGLDDESSSGTTTPIEAPEAPEAAERPLKAQKYRSGEGLGKEPQDSGEQDGAPPAGAWRLVAAALVGASVTLAAVMLLRRR